MSSSLTGVTVKPQANVYFDGKCISHSLTQADGLPSGLIFDTLYGATTLDLVATPADSVAARGRLERALADRENFVLETAEFLRLEPSQEQFDVAVNWLRPKGGYNPLEKTAAA